MVLSCLWLAVLLVYNVRRDPEGILPSGASRHDAGT